MITWFVFGCFVDLKGWHLIPDHQSSHVDDCYGVTNNQTFDPKGTSTHESWVNLSHCWVWWKCCAFILAFQKRYLGFLRVDPPFMNKWHHGTQRLWSKFLGFISPTTWPHWKPRVQLLVVGWWLDWCVFFLTKIMNMSWASFCGVPTSITMEWQGARKKYGFGNWRYFSGISIIISQDDYD